MSNKVVVLGVTGSIAAYKAVDLTSMLVKVGVDVNVIMTEAARKIITEQAFFTLSKNRVVTDLWTIPDWKPGHIELAEKADLFVVAPCTANFMGKYVNGIADDALTTFALSHTGKTVLAPAMNTNMWNNQHKLEMTMHGVHLGKHTYRNLWDFFRLSVRVKKYFMWQ